MRYHILNGDALKTQIPTNKIDGNFIICRESLIDGDISGDSLIEFWDNRANFIEQTYGAEAGRYNDHALPQFQKILDLSPSNEVNLWFGDDLFCQMNLCFIVYLLDTIGCRDHLFLVKAQSENWLEFGGMSPADLVKAYENKVRLTKEDAQLLVKTWKAFQGNDLAELTILAKTKTTNFPHFQEVIQAHIDRFPLNGELARPQQRLLAIKEKLQTNNFGQIFQQFSEEEGIYGFGDLQVKAMFDDLNRMTLAAS